MSVSDLIIRRARETDLTDIIAMFAADEKGGHGDTTDPDAFEDYLKAFYIIDASPNENLYVAELGGEVVGTFQLLFTRTLTGRGSLTMVLEAVQTRPDMRSRGIGKAMVDYAVEEARRRDCRVVRLTSNDTRTDAHRFYERHGFEKTHAGFKLALK